MNNSILINIIPDTEYNKLMLDEKEKYYQNKNVNFYSNYKTQNEAWEWKEPTTPREIFFEIIKKIKIDNNWVFMDCGCGLGHAVYLATFFFHKVFGVEYIKEVAETAIKNLTELLPKSENYKIFSCDMFNLDNKIFNDINVFYISSPFMEENLFEKLINLIINSISNKEREVWIIYFYPYCERLMEKYSGIFPLVDTLETIGKVNYYHHKLL